ncbi:MAG: type 4a pilus biogenesis protein PilO [Nitrospirota bacterium]|nr:MAG: type 4a pilus biogenesis protein PilO [Nitrospirota bacterium]
MDPVPKSRNLALGVVMIGLVVCGFYVCVWGPIKSRTEIVRGDVQQLGQEIQHYKTQNLHRHDWQARIKELETRVYGERQNVQQARGQGGLRNRVMGIAQNHQLEITYWQPEALGEGTSDVMKGASIRVQIEGGYHQVASFFSRVLHLPDVFGISHFTIGVTNDQPQPFQLQTNFVMTRLNPILPREGPRVGPRVSNKVGQRSGI